MKTCHECKLEIPENQICHDMFGDAYHPQCYVDAYPPYQGLFDRERERALKLVSQAS